MLEFEILPYKKSMAKLRVGLLISQLAAKLTLLNFSVWKSGWVQFFCYIWKNKTLPVLKWKRNFQNWTGLKKTSPKQLFSVLELVWADYIKISFFIGNNIIVRFSGG